MCLELTTLKYSNHSYVFLYFTGKINNSTKTENSSHNNKLLFVANHLCRYKLLNGKLINPKHLLNLPSTLGPWHNGGAMIIGPDHNLYLPIVDVDGHKSQAQDVIDGDPLDRILHT